MPPNNQPLSPPPAPPQSPAPSPLDPRGQVAERLKQANTVLVTVSANPTVDQLAACIGMTLLLNKAGKHATAIFSGKIPSTIEFLQPLKTLEQTTDSLQDFIIALDKSKADKLRYKVENDVVRIFITPYHAALSKDDLEFSHGDFNVEVVLALGVLKREDLDQVILAHGRILHDATVIGVTNGNKRSDLGAINWQDQAASSLCEMSVVAGSLLGPGLIDNQIATSFLTGIVAETERFRNDKTTPQVMNVSAQLMQAGANQQLIANKLEQQVETFLKTEKKAEAVVLGTDKVAQKPDEGTLSIDHGEEIEINEAGRLKRLQDEQLAAEAAMAGSNAPTILPEPTPEPEVRPLHEEVEQSEPAEEPLDPVNLDEEPEEEKPERPPTPDEPPEPPAEAEIIGHNLLSGDVPDVGLTANTVPEFEQPDPSSDPLSSTDRKDHPILKHNKKKDHHKTIEPSAKDNSFSDAVAEDKGDKLPDSLKPLTEPPKPEDDDIEKLIGSTHQPEPPPALPTSLTLDEDKERAKVEQIKLAAPDMAPSPIKALNAEPLGEPLRTLEPVADKPPTPVVLDPTKPPTAPPPIMPIPLFFDPNGQVDNPYLNPNNIPKPFK